MKIKSSLVFLLVIFVLFLLARQTYQSIEVIENIDEQDIYYAFVEGQRILQGENPYERILLSDMRKNDKYATYFPLFYELSYVSQAFGLDQFTNWLLFWRRIFLAFNFATGVLLYYVFDRENMRVMGVFAALFWFFNRWTLTVVNLVHLDFLPVFFLTASLIVFPRNRRFAFLLFGVSLALKQIAIFLLPLYLIWTWLSTEKNRVKELFMALLLIGSVPLLASIPFLIWNARGFLLSVLFSVSRFASGHFDARSLDDFLGWHGFVGRLPMLMLFLLIYWFCFSRSIPGRYMGAFLIMSVFVAFNAVLYVQYMIWLVPLTLLLLLDTKEKTVPKLLEA